MLEEAAIQELQQKLKKEQARLRAALSSVAKEGKSFEPSFQEMDSDEEASQNEVEKYEANIAAEKELEPMLYRIEHALNKIQRHTYGVCEKCGADIPVERLQAAPEAEYCLEHAEEAEA